MTNVTVLTYGRPRLVAQCIESLRRNTPGDFRVTTFDDEAKLGTGMARNKVIAMARENRGDYLYLSDSDVYFQPHWLETLIEAYEWARATHNVIALGAYAHPFLKTRQLWPFFSGVLGRTIQIGELDALPTQSWLWKWEDWDKFGPFVATPVGKVCQSEDVEMSQKIQASGGKVAAIYPPLVVNCGVLNSFGEKIPGYDEVMREPLPPGVYRG